MVNPLGQSIVDELDSMTCFKSKILVKHGTEVFDVSTSVGHNPSISPEIPDQPPKYPIGSCYCFPPEFRGKESFNALVASLSKTCSDCSLVIRKRDIHRKRDPYVHYELRCSRHRVNATDKSDFDKGCFTKRDTVPAHNKRKRSKNEKTVIDRMNNPKMKGKSANDPNPSPQKPSGSLPSKRRTNHYSSDCNERKCPMILRIIMHPSDGRFYLMSSSDIGHMYHYPNVPESNQLSPTDLSDDDRLWMDQMVSMGLSSGQIASMVTGYFNKSGRQGKFLASVIKNMVSKHQLEVDLLAGIEKDFSIAQKTLSRLNE